MIALSYLSAIRFSGTDAGDFLHNQVSADVLGLAPDASTLACYCEPKGRVLALLLVSRHGDDYYAVLSRSLVTAVATRLRMYVLRAKVEVEMLDNCVVAGTSEPVMPPSLITAVAVPGGSNRFLLVSGTELPTTDPALPDAWKVSELLQGIVWLCPATSGQFLPQMLGYDSLGAVNFRKGCYPGQEIVARTHYLGKVKRHPRLLCTTAVISPAPLDKIQIHSNGEAYTAVIADSGQRKDGGSCLFVVSRLGPEMIAEKIEYQGQIAPLSSSD